MWKSSLTSMPVCRARITTESTITGRNSSIRSKARLGRPSRRPCRKPEYGSRPAVSSAATDSWLSRLYPRLRAELMGSGGGLRWRPENDHVGSSIEASPPK